MVNSSKILFLKSPFALNKVSNAIGSWHSFNTYFKGMMLTAQKDLLAWLKLFMGVPDEQPTEQFRALLLRSCKVLKL
jgi:hypothetical protein